ncbi:MAG TPA: UvrD-helicase domain-containing protein [Gallionellaceae bacterium]
MDNQVALDPSRSIVVEACAGSGKTWLLVSRIVRLLIDGAEPANILAITFTRKAAQEMQARLQLWLRELAAQDDAWVRRFLAERGLEAPSAAQLARARSLHARVLLAQPGITISTFHGWFMQVMQRAPLNADVMQGMNLLERAGSVQDEAWEELMEQMLQPDDPVAPHMQRLFEQYGLHNTRKLLFGFLNKRAEWWAYASAFAPDASNYPEEEDGNATASQDDIVRLALGKLQAALEVELDFDAAADWGQCGNVEEEFFAFARQLAANGTAAQQAKAAELERAWTDSAPEARFAQVWPLLFQKSGEPRKLNPTKKQDETTYATALHALQASLQAVRDAETELKAYRLNEDVLHCGAALLARYQALKRQGQQMDFPDLEWQLCRLLQHSEHAETMQYKLDCRYRHVLLDEFQDTNPLQWQTLRAWFDAAAAAETRPTVFIVGDPKQSIYRFRRADARLFGVARAYLVDHYDAHALHNNHTRRNAPAVLGAVNAVFKDHPEGFDDFEPHTAEHAKLPGHVAVLPLEHPAAAAEAEATESALTLRDPLTTRRAESEEGARRKEAAQFAALLQTMVREWQVMEDGQPRKAAWSDIMVLVRSRTHLATYEEALRARHIPFISSRRGGLLDTLEAEDVQALLMFLITPFADLALAQVLRTPIFSCSDEDLMRLAQNAPSPSQGEGGGGGVTVEPDTTSLPEDENKKSWWRRLQSLPAPSPALSRAAELLQRWLALADKLPVHDLLDRIYFEGDVLARYSAAQLPEMRAKVAANLHAFISIALEVDAGRYPSLPRFLQELRELRDSRDDAPDEGKLGIAGDAVRIYTVHESKGLEANIVWLLDANGDRKHSEGYDVLLDWPAQAQHPLHFSLHADLASRGRKRASIFEQEAAQQAREEMNLLYVAMTRARQALIVSGHGKGADKEQNKKAPSWYDRIAAVAKEQPNPLGVFTPSPLALSHEGRGNGGEHPTGSLPPGGGRLGRGEEPGSNTQTQIPSVKPTGKRKARPTREQQRGIRLHALLQHMTSPRPPAGEGQGERGSKEALQHRLNIPHAEMAELWPQAQALLAAPELARFFDAGLYRAASNEMPYVNAAGELKRIDRLVEFEQEVWVLDYKMGESEDAARYRKQMEEYRAAMRAIYAGKQVRCALVYAGGVLKEV